MRLSFRIFDATNVGITMQASEYSARSHGLR